MGRLIVRRSLQGIIVLFLVSVVVFLLTRASGDPTSLLLPPEATPEEVADLREHFGLDQSLVTQYWLWLRDLLHGNLGTSFRTGLPVTTMIGTALPNTLSLGTVSLLIAVVVGLPLGVAAALRRNGWLDAFAKSVSSLGLAAPHFWVAIMLILVFAVKLRWFPTSGTGGIEHLVLPAVTLGFGVVTAGVMRLARSSMLDALDSEYLVGARAKGVPERKVILVHALRNSITPVVSYLGIYIALLLSGSAVVETIFRWPGLGLLVYQAVLTRDFPVVQGVVLMVALSSVVVNFLVDILYAVIDPRIRV